MNEPNQTDSGFDIPDPEDKNARAVIALVKSRAAAGLNKYGVTTEREDLTPEQWITHAQEEALDLAIYLERLKELQKRVGELEDANAALERSRKAWIIGTEAQGKRIAELEQNLSGQRAPDPDKITVVCDMCGLVDRYPPGACFNSRCPRPECGGTLSIQAAQKHEKDELREFVRCMRNLPNEWAAKSLAEILVRKFDKLEGRL